MINKLIHADNLKNKLLYAFGTSIVYGHLAGRSFVDDLGCNYGIKFKKLAVNGATTRLTSDNNNIISQIENAPARKPDFVIFDSVANDAYPQFIKNDSQLGKITSDFNSSLDINTYCGGLENICKTLLIKYRGAKIMYLATHKTCARDFETQEILYKMSKGICHKWSIEIIDLYNNSNFNTFINEYRYNYTYDKVDENGGNHSCDGSGTHPNNLGYSLFYDPIVAKALL